MKNRNILKKMIALTLSFIMIAGSIVIEEKAEKKVFASEKQQNYIIQVSSESALENTLEKYDKAETVSDAVQNELEQENMASVSLTKSEADKLKKSKNIVTIEKDKKVKAAKSNKVKKIDCKDIDLEWNKKLIKSDAQKRKK